MQHTNPVDAFLRAVESATIGECDAWAPDAVVDATVPNWRFRMEGPDAIRAQYAGWFADPGKLVRVRREPIPGGEVVEYVLRWVENGEDHVAHHVHLLTVRDGRIEADTVMCGGRWPASLCSEMGPVADA
jgi:hypothetical protein